MKNKIASFSLLMCFGLLMMGCSTDSSSNCPEDFTGALSSDENEFVGTWALSDIVSQVAVDLTDDGVDNPSTEIFDQLPDCQKDVEYIFGSDRGFTVRQQYNATGCTNKLSLDGTFKYVSSQLSFNNACVVQTITVQVNVDFTEFTVNDNYTFNEVDGSTTSSSVVLTYSKSL